MIPKPTLLFGPTSFAYYVSKYNQIYIYIDIDNFYFRYNITTSDAPRDFDANDNHRQVSS